MVSIDDRVGGYFVGAFVACFLSGLIVSQAITYFHAYPNGTDRQVFRWGVVFLVICDLFLTVCACVSCYVAGVEYNGRAEEFVSPPWSFSINPAMTGIVALLVQLYRVWVVSGKRLAIPLVIILLAVVQFAFSIGASYVAFTHRFVEFVPTYSFGVSTWLGCSCLCDFIIAGSIVFYLQRARTGTPFRGTSTVLLNIMRATLETNLATALVALLDACLFVTLGATNWHSTVNIVLPKLYCCSFLFALTVRARLNRDTFGIPLDKGLSWEEKVVRSSKRVASIRQPASPDDISLPDLQ